MSRQQEQSASKVNGNGGQRFSPAELERQIEKITASGLFKDAKTLRKLLDYLARRTFENPDISPKENEIAAEVLDRAPDYDSRVDSSARVLVARLRSKLAEYYVAEGRADPIQVELPRGSYTLRFHPPSEQVAAAPSDPVKPAPAGIPRSRLLWIGAVLMVVSAGLGFLAATRLAADAGVNARRAQWTAEMERFWGPFTVPSRPVLIVLGTPLFANVSEFLLRRPDLNTWADLSRDPKVREAERIFGSRARPAYSYAAAGDSIGGLLLTRLLASRQSDIRFRRSSTFEWEDLGSHSAIFLGAPKIHLPTRYQYLPVDLPFVCQPEGISNRQPLPGEPALFKDDAGQFHVAVTRLSGIQGLGEILVIASMRAEGTWGAVEYFIKPANLKELLSRLRNSNGGFPPRYQVLLRVKMVEQTPMLVTYIAHRELS